ncbi:hypothetical protein D3C72_1796850 [compost metagenome]
MLQRFQRGREHQVIHIVGNKRVIRGTNAKLHRQIQAGGRFAAARYAKQNHLGLIEITHRNPVVVRQGVINRGDTRVIFDQVARIEPVSAMGNGRRVEF